MGHKSSGLSVVRRSRQSYASAVSVPGKKFAQGPSEEDSLITACPWYCYT